MAYATEKDIAHTLTSIVALGTTQGGPMGATFSENVPRAGYAAGSNRAVMAAPLADGNQHLATTMFFDVTAKVDKSTAGAAVVASYSAPDGGTGSCSVSPLVAGNMRKGFGRVGEPAQQDFESEGTVTESVSI